MTQELRYRRECLNFTVQLLCAWKRGTCDDGAERRFPSCSDTVSALSYCQSPVVGLINPERNGYYVLGENSYPSILPVLSTDEHIKLPISADTSNRSCEHREGCSELHNTSSTYTGIPLRTQYLYTAYHHKIKRQGCLRELRLCYHKQVRSLNSYWEGWRFQTFQSAPTNGDKRRPALFKYIPWTSIVFFRTFPGSRNAAHCPRRFSVALPCATVTQGPIFYHANLPTPVPIQFSIGYISRLSRCAGSDIQAPIYLTHLIAMTWHANVFPKLGDGA